MFGIPWASGWIKGKKEKEAGGGWVFAEIHVRTEPQFWATPHIPRLGEQGGKHGHSGPETGGQSRFPAVCTQHLMVLDLPFLPVNSEEQHRPAGLLGGVNGGRVGARTVIT